MKMVMEIKKEMKKERTIVASCMGAISTAVLMLTLYMWNLGEGEPDMLILLTVVGLSFCPRALMNFAAMLYDRGIVCMGLYTAPTIKPPIFASLVVWASCFICGLSSIPVLLAGPCEVKFFAWHVILTVLGISGITIILGKLALEVMGPAGINFRTLLKLVFSKMSRDEIGEYLGKISEENIEPNPDAGNSPR